MTDWALWLPEHETNHQICIRLQLVFLSNMGVITSTAAWLQERGAEHRHRCTHHVPVELLLREPEGQRAPPTAGHCGHAVWIHRTRGEAHQSTTAGFYSSLRGGDGRKSWFSLSSHDLPGVEKQLTVTVFASLLVKNSSPPSKLSFR